MNENEQCTGRIELLRPMIVQSHKATRLVSEQESYLQRVINQNMVIKTHYNYYIGSPLFPVD